MNEVWRARSGIAAQVRTWSSPVRAAITWPPVRGSGWKRCLTALTATADLPAGLPDRDRRLRVHCRWERPFTAVGQWIKRASQEDLARLHAPWDPVTGRYRAPDEKPIRVALNWPDSRAPSPGTARAVTMSGAPPSRRKRSPAAGYGPWPWMARPSAGPAALTAFGSTSSASPDMASVSWITLRPASSTTRPFHRGSRGCGSCHGLLYPVVDRPTPFLAGAASMRRSV